MEKFKEKKLLVMAGKPIGSYEIVEHAKKCGAHVTVTDFLPATHSVAKTISDENWNISTADVDLIVSKIRENKIDGVYTGVHEFNIEKMIEICEKAQLPCFCTIEQWKALNNKKFFKDLCRKNGIPVAKEYDATSKSLWDDIKESDFPVIVKPVDGSGSRGFSICNNVEELRQGIEKASKHSSSDGVLIEQYMNYRDSAIINYTIVDGKIYFCGISDKKSKKVFDFGAPVMAVQYYPSIYANEYLINLDEKVKKMFLSFGLKNGVIWIEAFCNDGKFTFNEMGYRFGGSLTYFPVKFLYGIDQLDLQLQFALNGKYEKIDSYGNKTNGIYSILPIHVKEGVIEKIEGFEKLEKRKETVKVVYVHHEKERIENWGSAQQVFAYLHFHCSNMEETKKLLSSVLDELAVYDEKGNNMLFYLYEENL